MVDMDESTYLSHIGIKRKSGRYPWGSGDSPLQRSKDFKSYYEDMTKNKGMTQAEVAKALTDYANHPSRLGDERLVTIKTQDIRAAIASSTENVREANEIRAAQLAKTNMSNGAIAEAMGLPRSAESTVRGWLKPSEDREKNSIRATSDTLKEHLSTKEFLDVGKGTHLYMGIAKTKLDTALSQLKDEGYNVHNIKVKQLGTGEETNTLVLTKADWGTTRKAVDAGDLQNVTATSEDGGLRYKTPRQAPVSLDSKRLEIRYAEDGGTKMDGVIEIRRGVEDLNLGAAKYAQARVAVDGTHYLKGMVMFADDLPAGVDVRFNTNKTKAEATAKGKLGALKDLQKKEDGTVDDENPFKAVVKRIPTYTDSKGKEKSSPLNLVNEEGDWDKWTPSLSSQMLSKQSIRLAETQLGAAEKVRRTKLDDIKSLTNPIVKQKMLDEFADSSDAAAVHLKAAALPRQATKVILPMNSLRRNEVFAPDYTDGEKVVLVRHPHGGPFEIPELVVNNKNAQARRLIRGARDAIGIHHSVAEQLSGADFDGDTVLLIPNNSRGVKTKQPLKDLEGFEPKTEYAPTSTSERMKKANVQKQMGDISNLITDMTIKKASDSEIARAVRHSMVVIDAEKHGLDFKRSAQDHNISSLKRTYQGGPTNGASTIVSRASSQARVPDFKIPSGARGVNPKTGEVVREPTGKGYVNKSGEYVQSLRKGTQMEFTSDARDLQSGGRDGVSFRIEEVYATHANSMKAMANEARLIRLNTASPLQNKAARNLYADEVKSLDAKLKVALRNAPLERQAQVLAGAVARARIAANPHYDKDDIKKVQYQELDRARYATGAGKTRIGSKDTGKDPNGSSLTEREWEAIQAGAISATKLREILANADMDRVQALATPRPNSSLTTTQINRAQALINSGRSLTDVAQLLGVPRSTLSNNV